MRAWKQIKAKDGAGGVDEESIEDVIAYGEEAFIEEIESCLKAGAYRPSPSMRIHIPKDTRSTRPLGLPTIRDKVVQMATKIVIEPIFEADFKSWSYGFRPKRSQHMALKAVKEACDKSGYWVVDADIKGFFDHINHEKLLKLMEERISDRRVIKLVKQWLKAGVIEDGKYEETEEGSPQGGVISPLLSNIYLNYMDRIWEEKGNKIGKMVRYADDAVVICKTKKDANHALGLIRYIMKQLNLELNEEKTRIVGLYGCKENFVFLGMRNQYAKLRKSNGREFSVLIQYPSIKAMRKIRTEINDVVGNRGKLKRDIKMLIDEINPKITGWRNYYGLKFAEKWMKKLDWHILQRFTRWWNKKKQRRVHLSNISGVRQLMIQYGVKKFCV